ncbi:MAG TPA: hypothetical protein VFJ58_12265 [Armatimonadota bacterium]|nr:hypothetical protein [Armatimonadota bacterium]
MHTPWLEWYYVIYWLPFGLATGILLVSSLGGRHGSHSHDGHNAGAGHTLSHAGHSLKIGGGHAPAAHSAPRGMPVRSAPAGHGAATHGAAAHSAASPSAARSGPVTPGPHGVQAGVRIYNAQTGREFEAHLHVGYGILGFFGFGRAPLTILIGSLMIGWGLAGIIATQAFQADFKAPDRFILPALAVAIVGAILFTKLLGELFARFMVEDETYAIHREDLVGLTGTVVYPVSETGGRIHVFDQFHTLHVEPARIRSGSAGAEKGAEVLVIGLDPEKKYLLVDAMKVEDGGRGEGECVRG